MEPQQPSVRRHAAAPADPAAVDALTAASPVPLPEAYLNHLRGCNGGEGSLAVTPGWIQIWPAECVWQRNADYDVPRRLPGFIGFGGNGGGELFAFDVRGGAPYPVVMLPFIAMNVSDAIVISPAFEHLVARLGRDAERRV